MAGRKRTVPVEIVHNLFRENEIRIIDDRKRVIVPKDTIWEELRKHELIKNKMTAKAIYTEALNWWKNIEDADQEPIEKEVNDFNGISIELSPPANKSLSFSTSFDTSIESNGVKFSITLAYGVWQTIQPVPKNYKRTEKTHKKKTRCYYTLEPGLWTNVLVDRIANHCSGIVAHGRLRDVKCFMYNLRF